MDSEWEKKQQRRIDILRNVALICSSTALIISIIALITR